MSEPHAETHSRIGRWKIQAGSSGEACVAACLVGYSVGLRQFPFPAEVIVVAVPWYLRYGLSYRDVEELLAERGIEVGHVTAYRWVRQTSLGNEFRTWSDRTAAAPLLQYRERPGCDHRVRIQGVGLGTRTPTGQASCG
jgi:hypothetical protein